MPIFVLSTLSFLCGPFATQDGEVFPATGRVHVFPATGKVHVCFLIPFEESMFSCDGKSPCVFSDSLSTQGRTFRACLARRYGFPCFLSISIFLALSAASVSLLAQGEYCKGVSSLVCTFLQISILRG